MAWGKCEFCGASAGLCVYISPADDKYRVCRDCCLKQNERDNKNAEKNDTEEL
jgi:hypothetical protein